MNFKKVSDHVVIQTPTCGELREVLRAGEIKDYDLAIAIDIQPNVAHFHRLAREVYFVMDGSVTVKMLDAKTGEEIEETMGANELCVIEPGVHHRITKASQRNRLCVICSPRWSADDEYVSDRL